MNHLEQLIVEWLEFNGYFVRRNVKVSKLSQGGFERSCLAQRIAF